MRAGPLRDYSRGRVRGVGALGRGGSLRGRSAARPGRVLFITGLALAGAGVASLATGVAFAVLTRSASDQFNNPAPGTPYDPSLQSTGKLDSAVAIATLAAGGALVATGTVLAVLGARTSRAARDRASSLRIVPLLSPRDAGVVLRVDF